MVEIVKRDGRKQAFNKYKIKNAIVKAMNSIGKNSEEDIQMADYIAFSIGLYYIDIDEKEVDIEKIQDTVIETLKLNGYEDVAKAYEEYREKRRISRDLNNNLMKAIEGLIDGTNEQELKENANKKGEVNSVVRDLMAGTVSRALAEKMLDKDIWQAHNEGAIKVHDTDYIANKMHNCGLMNAKDMLDNGTCINDVKIEKPKSLRTAMNLVTQLLCQVSSNQYGGITFSIAHLSPYVRLSKEKIEKKVRGWGLPISEKEIDRVVDEELRSEIKDSIQLLNYQLLTFQTTNGQSVFCSISLYLKEDMEYIKETAMLIEELFKQRLEGMPNKFGVKTIQTFPKLLYFMSDNCAYKGSEYYYLTEMAAKCIAYRMSPDIMSEKVALLQDGCVIPTMGCRSRLSPYYNEKGELVIWGRGNVGVCTINLPYIALLAKEQNKDFFEVLDQYLDLCKRVGIFRFKKLKGVKAKVNPVGWMYGGYARLNAEDDIYEYIKDKFTVSLGFTGLAECVYALCGETQLQPIGNELAKTIMEHLDETCKMWKEETGYLFGVYGTPSESSTDWFATRLKKRFGIVEGVTDHDYVTNSYHIRPNVPVDAFTKISVEAEFQKHSTGGAISYIECPCMHKNIEAVIQVMQHIYETSLYCELNIRSDYCAECGSYMVANLDENDQWSCPICGCTDYDKLSIVLRVCGYVADVKYCNHGRLSDIRDRVKHL